MSTTYSPLRYPGGKTKFYPYVKKIIQCNNLLSETYIEPFAGGAGLALKLLLNNDVRRIVINDLDSAIYSFWYSVLYETEQLCELIHDTPISVTEWKKQRDIYFSGQTSPSLEYSFATFFLNRTNVSGVIKGGIIGGKNQQGKYKMQARYNTDALIEKIILIAAQKDRITLLNEDAKYLLTKASLRRFYKVFINLDPPYVNKGAQLYKNSFSTKDHVDLYYLISQCNRKWIVTYDVCPLVKSLYTNYRSSYLDVQYSVNNSRKSQEYIFFSNNLILPPDINLI